MIQSKKKKKKQLKHSTLPKRTQARVVQACVKSRLLFDCVTRTWYQKDTKKLQQWIDKAYRYIWSNRREQPLRWRSIGEGGEQLYAKNAI